MVGMKKIPLILLACGLIVTGLIIALPQEKNNRHKEDIELAKQYSKNQGMCTAEYKELVSPDGQTTYGASDGCEIRFLKERGWTEPDEQTEEAGTVKTCLGDEECGWVSTNCCSENMGANWACLNEKETEIDCPENPVCPAVISPRPTAECSCIKGTCESTKQ